MSKIFKCVLLLAFVLLNGNNYSQIIERGLGYSGLVHMRRSGKDINHDRFADFSYGEIFSEKAYDSDEGKIKETYSLPQFSELQSAFILTTEDLNGDGLDETLVVYNWGKDIDNDGFYDGSKLIVYDGIDGHKMFSYEMDAENGLKNKSFKIITGDFDGNGKNDVACISLISHELLGYSPVTGIEITALNYKGEKFYKKDLFSPNDTISFKYLNSNKGDFNGDQIDDIIIAYSVDTGNEIKVVALDLYDNSILSDFHTSDFSSIKILKYGDFTKDGIDEIVCVGNDAYSDSSRLEVFSQEGNIKTTYLTENNIDYLFADDFSGDFSSEIVFIENSSNYTTNPKIYSISSLNEVPSKVFELSGGGQNRIEKAIDADFDNDGKKDIAFVGGNSSEKNIYVINISGNIIVSHHEEESNNQTLFLGYGDFNGNGFKDFVLVKSWGVDVDNDGFGDNSFLEIIDTENDSTIFSYHPFDETSGGYGGYLFAVLKNEITDKELLRSIDFKNSEENISQIYSAFLLRDYESATEKLFDFYRNYTRFIPFELREYYNVNGEDILSDYIKKFSTFSGREEPAINSWNNYFRAVATIAIRMKRITSTMWYRLRYNSMVFNKSEFLLTLKSIYSHLIFSSRKDQFTYGTNHGALFELEGYVPASVSLNIFKEYNSDEDVGWLNTLDLRLHVQMDHVLPDGVHDEHSLYYAFRVNLSFNRIADFQRLNSSIFNLSENTLSELAEKIALQNNYLLYAVKPVPIIRDEHYVFLQSDIPCIGDTKGIWGGNLYGKAFRSHDSFSFLIYPDYYYNGWQIKDSLLIDNLRFSANGLFEFPNSHQAPSEISKMFSNSGIFISRSNWSNSEGNFDSLARYCYFKGGEMIPTPGPYNGYSTTSLHGHADLETVEISGYGKNLIQELGGYVNPADTQISNNLSENNFSDLYNYSSSSDAFNKARHYFKGTPAHNTVYVNDEDQAEYLGHYSWGGISNLEKNVSSYSIDKELDYYLAGYKKKDKYTHNREMFYVKPKIEDRIKDDYWIFTDEINFVEEKENKTEQIWNIAPLESDGTLDTTTGIYRTDNFVVIPLLEIDNNKIDTKLIQSFNLTDLILIQTKTLKYSKLFYGKKSRYCTIIFPYQSEKNYTNFSINRIDVFTEDNTIVESEDALAFKLTYERNGEVINDFIFISEAEGKKFSYYLNNNKITTSYKFVLNRFVDDLLVKEMYLPWENINVNYDERGTKEFLLQQNFPNPFNNETKINFYISSLSKVTLNIYDILGRKIKTLVNAFLREGDYSFVWDGTNSYNHKVSSGVYFYRIIVNSESETKKIMRIK